MWKNTQVHGYGYPCPTSRNSGHQKYVAEDSYQWLTSRNQQVLNITCPISTYDLQDLIRQGFCDTLYGFKYSSPATGYERPTTVTRDQPRLPETSHGYEKPTTVPRRPLRLRDDRHGYSHGYLTITTDIKQSDGQGTSVILTRRRPRIFSGHGYKTSVMDIHDQSQAYSYLCM